MEATYTNYKVFVLKLPRLAYQYTTDVVWIILMIFSASKYLNQIKYQNWLSYWIIHLSKWNEDYPHKMA